MMPGGLSDEKPGDDHVRSVVDSVKTEMESKLAIKLGAYDVVGYKTQVVAGINYFVKIKAGGAYYLLRIFNSIPNVGSPSFIDAKSTTVSEDIRFF